MEEKVKNLVILVDQRPPIWNKSSTQDDADKCWKEISSIMKVDEKTLRKLWELILVVAPDIASDSKCRPSSGGQDADEGDSQRTNDNDSLPPSQRNTEDVTPTDNRDNVKAVPLASTSETASKRSKESLAQQMDAEQQEFKMPQEKRKPRQNEENEHLLFLKSLLPHLERIPKHRIISFRNDIIRLLNEFAYGVNRETYSGYHSWSSS